MIWAEHSHHESRQRRYQRRVGGRGSELVGGGQSMVGEGGELMSGWGGWVNVVVCAALGVSVDVCVRENGAGKKELQTCRPLNGEAQIICWDG